MTKEPAITLPLDVVERIVEAARWSDDSVLDRVHKEALTIAEREIAQVKEMVDLQRAVDAQKPTNFHLASIKDPRW